MPLSIIACLLVIFVPLPSAAIDILLAGNISLAVIILLTTLHVRTPLEFSVFPAILLVTTVARLSLNIATTRLILSNGATSYESSAGKLIQAFGEFVAGDHIAIGLVIFSIIVIIQFVVITKGATRISEVTARFALDGMPGRQLSIDADLNSGAIDKETAQLERQKLSANADFYGAMDGASKFVRGDAIAGILITLVNIVGGLVVGLTSNMSLSEAASVFTKLTIGDGLVSQLPALFISIAAAMLVSRPTTESNLPRDSFQQTLNNPSVLVITAMFLLVMMFTGLPKVPLLVLAALFLAGARYLPQLAPKQNSIQAASKRKEPAQEVTIDKLLGNEILDMELGLDLIPLADPKSGGKLLPAVTNIRKSLASNLGVILPKIRIKDNLQLPAREYRILVQGNPVDIGTIFPDCELAIDEGSASGPITGAVATETTEDGQAFWIRPSHHQEALDLGYQVQNPTAVLTSRLDDIITHHAPDLLTRDATNELIEETRKSSPAIVEELIPDPLSLMKLQQILKQLVAEQVSIRPLGLILETIGDSMAQNDDRVWSLVEQVRQRLAPQITAKHLGSNHAISAVTVEEHLQEKIANHCTMESGTVKTTLDPETLMALTKALRQGSQNMSDNGNLPVVCVRQDIRPIVSSMVSEQKLGIVVLGSKEIVGTYVESVGEISLDQIQLESAAA